MAKTSDEGTQAKRFTISNDIIAKNNYSLNSLNYMKQEAVQQVNLDTLLVERTALLEKDKVKEVIIDECLQL